MVNGDKSETKQSNTGDGRSKSRSAGCIHTDIKAHHHQERKQMRTHGEGKCGYSNITEAPTTWPPGDAEKKERERKKERYSNGG